MTNRYLHKGTSKNLRIGIARCEKPPLCTDLCSTAVIKRWVFRSAHDEFAPCVDRAIEKLRANDAKLPVIGVNERSISPKLAEYLQQEIPGRDIDYDYNRKMGNRKTLHVSYTDVTGHDIGAKAVFPNIIVDHGRTDDNLLVVEMKWFTEAERLEATMTRNLEVLGYGG